MPILAFEAVSKHYRHPSGEVLKALDEVSFSIAPGKKARHHRTEREREVDPASSRGGHRRPERGEGRASRSRRLASLGPRAHAPAARRHRSRVPVLLSSPAPHRLGERGASRLDCVRLRLGRTREASSRACGARGAGASGGLEAFRGRDAAGRHLPRSPAESRSFSSRTSPPGNLDDENSGKVMDLLMNLVDEEGGTLLYVTHSEEQAAQADERLRLHGGKLEPRVIRYFLRAARAQLRSGRSLFLLSLFGVALGVASVVGIQIINLNALGAFRGQHGSRERRCRSHHRRDAARSSGERLSRGPRDRRRRGRVASCIASTSLSRTAAELFLELIGVDFFTPIDVPWEGPEIDFSEALSRPGWVAVTPELARERGWNGGRSIHRESRHTTSGALRRRAFELPRGEPIREPSPRGDGHRAGAVAPGASGRAPPDRREASRGCLARTRRRAASRAPGGDGAGRDAGAEGAAGVGSSERLPAELDRAVSHQPLRRRLPRLQQHSGLSGPKTEGVRASSLSRRDAPPGLPSPRGRRSDARSVSASRSVFPSDTLIAQGQRLSRERDDLEPLPSGGDPSPRDPAVVLRARGARSDLAAPRSRPFFPRSSSAARTRGRSSPPSIFTNGWEGAAPGSSLRASLSSWPPGSCISSLAIDGGPRVSSKRFS